MRMQSPELMSVCQQVQFKSESESIYPDSLRKEPEKHCLSTLESCGQALMYLEPSIESAKRAKQTLEGAMRCMVEKRISVSELEIGNLVGKAINQRNEYMIKTNSGMR